MDYREFDEKTEVLMGKVAHMLGEDDLISESRQSSVSDEGMTTSIGLKTSTDSLELTLMLKDGQFSYKIDEFKTTTDHLSKDEIYELINDTFNSNTKKTLMSDDTKEKVEKVIGDTKEKVEKTLNDAKEKITSNEEYKKFIDQVKSFNFDDILAMLKKHDKGKSVEKNPFDSWVESLKQSDVFDDSQERKEVTIDNVKGLSIGYFKDGKVMNLNVSTEDNDKVTLKYLQEHGDEQITMNVKNDYVKFLFHDDKAFVVNEPDHNDSELAEYELLGVAVHREDSGIDVYDKDDLLDLFK